MKVDGANLEPVNDMSLAIGFARLRALDDRLGHSFADDFAFARTVRRQTRVISYRLRSRRKWRGRGP